MKRRIIIISCTICIFIGCRQNLKMMEILLKYKYFTLNVRGWAHDVFPSTIDNLFNPFLSHLEVSKVYHCNNFFYQLGIGYVSPV